MRWDENRCMIRTLPVKPCATTDQLGTCQSDYEDRYNKRQLPSLMRRTARTEPLYTVSQKYPPILCQNNCHLLTNFNDFLVCERLTSRTFRFVYITSKIYPLYRGKSKKSFFNSVRPIYSRSDCLRYTVYLFFEPLLANSFRFVLSSFLLTASFTPVSYTHLTLPTILRV